MTIMHRTGGRHQKPQNRKKEKINKTKQKLFDVFLVVNSSFCNDLENSIKKKEFEG